MAALSTLELMLHELQSQDSLDHFGAHGKMPMLPQRPVSKARMPTNRARRAVLSLHMQHFGVKPKEEFVDSRSKRDGFEFFDDDISFSKKNMMKNGEEEKEEKGIIGIQKCFRGYQARSHYHKLKEAVITLQSFIRVQKARKEFEISTRRRIQTHIDQDFVWKPLRNQETTIINLQSVFRAWLSRRHIGYKGATAIKSTKEAGELHEENMEKLDQVTVSQSYIRNLEQQVLSTEAALQHKEQENYDLGFRIQQIDREWELHNAMMNSKERIWQEELTSIQMNLESASKTKPNENTSFPQNPAQHQDDYGEANLTIRQILELQETDFDFHVDDILNSRKTQKHERRKLKARFKTWMKQFKVRLHEVKRIFDRYEDDQTVKVHKTCFHS